NRLNWMQATYDLRPTDTLFQKTPITFDVSVWELFWWFFGGAKLFVPAQGKEKNVAELAEDLVKHKITVIHFVPSMLNAFVTYCKLENTTEFPDLRYVLCSGEPLKYQYVQQYYEVFATSSKLINLYGPTEATVDVTSYECGPELEVLIGKPIDNIRLYIVDEQEALVPIGVAGELCIAGAGVARGYMNDPEKTNQSFKSNPFHQGPYARMYKTGDLCRWLPDGNIQFLNRIDHQIKLRGYRIELEEIEQTLMLHSGVADAVIVKSGELEELSYLSAFYIGDSDIPDTELKRFLSLRLPTYMIPEEYFRVDAFPLTTSGKVDRRKLRDSIPAPIKERGSSQLDENYLEIFLEALGRSADLTLEDHYFQVGGNSLNALLLVAKLNKRFKTGLSIRDIFAEKTIGNIIRKSEEARGKIESVIVPSGPKSYYRVLPAQSHLYTTCMLVPDSTLYNVTKMLRIEGELKIERLDWAFGQLSIHYEALRTSFGVVDQQVVQFVHPEAFAILEYRRIDEQSREMERNRLVRPFNLGEAPLLRAYLLEARPDSFDLVIDAHHLICDGVSLDRLIQDLFAVYAGNSLAVGTVQPKDYAEWLWDRQLEERGAELPEWLLGELPRLELPLDGERADHYSIEGNTLTWEIPSGIWHEVRHVAAIHNKTPFMMLFAVYVVLLYKYTNQDDVVIGTPTSGRDIDEIGKMVGMFMNTAIYRISLRKDMTVSELLEIIEEQTSYNLAQGPFLYHRLLNEGGFKREKNRNGIYDTMFVYQNFDRGSYTVPGLNISPINYMPSTAKFDLSLAVLEDRDSVRVEVEYRSDLLAEERIRRFMNHYLKLIEELLSNLSAPILSLEMNTELNKQELLEQFNRIEAVYDISKTLPEMFEQQAEQSPESIAVVSEDGVMTYRQLNEEANRIAHVLLRQGVRKGDIVAVTAEKSTFAIAGIIAVLKAGAAFLTVNLLYPEERTRFVMQDCRVRFALVNQQHIGRLPDNVYGIVLKDPERASESVENVGVKTSPNDLAYVIYTSGSTGTPKGVMIEHRSVINLIHHARDNYYARFGRKVHNAMVAPLVFDVAVERIFSSLMWGHRLYLVPDDAARVGESLLHYYLTHRIDVSDGTPTHLQMLVEQPPPSTDWCVSLLLIGGEALPVSLVTKLMTKFERPPAIINVYGPTECCVDSFYYEIRPEKLDPVRSIPIGRPIPNAKAFVLGADMQLLPVGVPGELYIGGPGVARGYINRDDQTKERFVANPFDPQETLYRTGDFVRWDFNGEMQFIGRLDNQVKVRGQRVELGEIEHILLKDERIRQAKAMVRNIEGQSELCIYFTSFISGLNIRELRMELARQLPSYMIPKYILQLEDMPVTANGKLDLKLLPDPRSNPHSFTSSEIEADGLEGQLKVIWTEVLGTEDIRLDDDFFVIGGHSLLAIVAADRISEITGVRDRHLLFKYSTIRGIAEHINNLQDNGEIENGRLI
ncbi:non-ribosomal peptide synthetase, partial [Paenibacillus xylaniclasticus]|uniref:non-ribosomal peptide synthetase n=1 Tax=Paenibacillus xylaniclasticus TaxID=588083 RepID=UPI000FDBB3F3